ncbi:MAG: family 10 glycosylhydrolase [Dehalococcoidia bacterium]|nr:family 10 glycosylhydrolase [Dehalococcoidia bacterium]
MKGTGMSDSHEVMFYTDGRHTSVYLYEPPMGVRQYVEPIDELLDLGIDTITYAVGDCSVLLYDTKVGERWGHNVDLTDHQIWYRAGMNAEQMIDSGTDPLMLVCEHAKKRGFQFLPHILLNMVHTDHGRVTNCRVADFTSEHPEWQVGPEPDYPEAEFDIPNRLSYAHPEVRADRLAVIRELVTDYPSDGVEMNFDDYTPLIARREIEEHTDTLTEWMRDIRQACDAAAAAQGIAKRLVVRMPGTLEGSKSIGLDLERWIREEIVETVIAMPVRGGWENDTALLREIVEVAEGTSVKVLAGHANSQGQTSRLTDYAAASNAYAVGAQGVLYHTYYPNPKRYPYNFETTGRIRFMGYPDIISHMDKTYRLTVAGWPSSIGRFAGVEDQLPIDLSPGEPGREVTLDVSDDIAAKADAGELWRCELRVLLDQRMHTDEVAVFWNDCEVPIDEHRWADWTYQLRPRPDTSLGYRLHIDLKKGLLPVAGTNRLRVDLLTKDETLIKPVSIKHVEIIVEYLPHRNALREDEKFED